MLQQKQKALEFLIKKVLKKSEKGETIVIDSLEKLEASFEEMKKEV